MKRQATTEVWGLMADLGYRQYPLSILSMVSIDRAILEHV